MGIDLFGIYYMDYLACGIAFIGAVISYLSYRSSRADKTAKIKAEYDHQLTSIHTEIEVIKSKLIQEEHELEKLDSKLEQIWELIWNLK